MRSFSAYGEGGFTLVARSVFEKEVMALHILV